MLCMMRCSVCSSCSLVVSSSSPPSDDPPPSGGVCFRMLNILNIAIVFLLYLRKKVVDKWLEVWYNNYGFKERPNKIARCGTMMNKDNLMQDISELMVAGDVELNDILQECNFDSAADILRSKEVISYFLYRLNHSIMDIVHEYTT